jgi:hypothetical protein
VDDWNRGHVGILLYCFCFCLMDFMTMSLEFVIIVLIAFRSTNFALCKIHILDALQYSSRLAVIQRVYQSIGDHFPAFLH